MGKIKKNLLITNLNIIYFFQTIIFKDNGEKKKKESLRLAILGCQAGICCTLLVSPQHYIVYFLTAVAHNFNVFYFLIT